MSYTRVTRHIGRTADPWHVSLGIREVKMTPVGTTLKAELRFGAAVLDMLGREVGGYVALGIGRDGDAGRFELTPGTAEDRMIATNGKARASYRINFPGAMLDDEPWPCARLEIVEAKRGRVVVAIPATKKGGAS